PRGARQRAGAPARLREARAAAAAIRSHESGCAGRESLHREARRVSVKSIGVLTAGGDAPGMNAAVRAVTRAALGSGLKVHGIHRAFEGLMQEDIFELGARDVGGILQRGGTVLQTERYPAFAELAVQQKAVAILRGRGIDALVAIGGDGTMRGALALHKLGFPVMGIPASIDNDVY